MSASTLTTTLANQPDIFRHYGKIAGVGYNQNMEIGPGLPRPVEASPYPDAMDTSLDLDSKQPNDQNQTSAAEHFHVLRAKPPAVQQPLPAAEPAAMVNTAQEVPGQMGKASEPRQIDLTLT